MTDQRDDEVVEFLVEQEIEQCKYTISKDSVPSTDDKKAERQSIRPKEPQSVAQGNVVDSNQVRLPFTSLGRCSRPRVLFTEFMVENPQV